MQKNLTILQDAQLALNALDTERAEEDEYPLHRNDFRSRLLVADGGNGLHVQYDGEVWEDAFKIALTAICEADADIVSLKFAGPDEGANGLRTHDFSALLASKATFPNLLELYIRPTDVSNHNFCGVDDNQLPALIARCPNLESLTLPHAPEANFFNQPLKKLRYLRVGMGWQLYDFIANLTMSNNMPELTILDFSDSLSVFEVSTDKPPVTLDNFDDSFTSFGAYQTLFASKALKKGAVFHLRNAYLTEAEFLQLEKMRPDLQFSLSIEAPHVYVSHWQGKFSKPFKHLIINNQ